LASAAIVGVVLWRIFAPRRPDAPVPEVMKPTKFVDLARDKVERVHLEAEVEKVRIRTQAEEANKQLDVIEEKGKADPKAARKDLADFLASGL